MSDRTAELKPPAADPLHPDRGGAAQPMLIVRNLRKYFKPRAGFLSRVVGTVKAVDDISFAVRKGEVLGIVGESGCGKSTVARLVMQLITPDAGEIIFDGERVGDLRGISIAALRQQVQLVFQDSYASLNPRMTIADSISYAPLMHGAGRTHAQAEANRLLSEVGLEAARFRMRYPHELSGGQRQRVNIARALAMKPRLLILDESVSALDKSVEAQVLNLLVELKYRLKLTYIFISHDLNVIEFMCDRVVVMYLGKIVESGLVDDIYAWPMHPYTRALLASKPSFDPRKRTTDVPVSGDPPSPLNPPSGCRFRTRCNLAESVCAAQEPSLSVHDGAREAHVVACHVWDPASGHSRSRDVSMELAR